MLRILPFVCWMIVAVSGGSALAAEGDASRHSTATGKRKAAFLVPMPDNACWQDFAYLAAVPAASKINSGNPVALAVDRYGTMRPEHLDFIRRYNPTDIYLLDCFEQPAPTTAGFLAYWPLDALEGESFRDHAGQCNAFLKYASVWTNVVTGNYSFDGRSIKVDTGAIPGSGRELTVAFWMKPQIAANQNIIAKTTRVNRGLGWQVMLRKDKDSKDLRFRVGGGDAAWNESDVVVRDAYTPGEWMHVTCTFADGVSKIYLNGSLRATRENITWSTPNNTRNPLQVGQSFTGMLDEVRIYHRALDSVEVQQLPGDTTAPPAGLISYWPLDETEGNIAQDRRGNQPLRFVGKPLWEPGREKGGILLTAKDGSLAAGAEDILLKPFSLLVTARSAKLQQASLLRKPGSADRIVPWSIHLNNADLNFQFGNNTSQRLTVANALPPNQTVQIIVHFDKKAVRIYLDGKLAGSAELEWDESEDAPLGNVFDGVLNHIALYEGADSAADLAPAARTRDCLAAWELAGGVLPSATAGEPRLVTGKSGNAMLLNGVNEYISSDTLLLQPSAWTFACWVKPEAAGCLISSLPYESAGPGWAVRLLEEGRTLQLLAGHEKEASPVDVGRQPHAFRMGEWVHISLTLSGEKVTLFLDGKRTIEWKPKGALRGGTNPFILGALHPGQQHLRGTLDEVRFYDRELSADEILGLFAANPDLSGFTAIPAASLQQATHSLAAKFWSNAETVVCSRSDDYESAMVASALAARLKAPLLYWEGRAFSKETAKLFNDLGAKRILAVGETPAVMPDGIDRIVLPDSLAVLGWMREQGIPVNYLAAVNPRDRDLGRVNKVSICGPLLAAGREGAVAVLDFETQWKVPIRASSKTAEKEDGMPESSIGWHHGQINLNGKTEAFVLTADKHESHRRIYVKDPDGKYQGPYRTGDRVELCGRNYTLALAADAGRGKADVWLTWPGVPEISQRLQSCYQALGRRPEYVCFVGEPDVIPHGIVAKDKSGCVDVPSDQPLANADDDPFLEMAIGRMVGEDLYSASLLTARGLAYDDLLEDEEAAWSGRSGSAGWESMLGFVAEQYGFTPVPHHDGKEGHLSDESPLCDVGLIMHGAHSWWLGFGGLVEWHSDVLTAPAVLESSGCSTMLLGRDEQGRSTPERLLRNGALIVAGNMREGVAQQYLYRSEFWNGILQGLSVGKAHRYALNRALLGMLDKNQMESGLDRYQFYNRALFGDPALRIRIPGSPRTSPARGERDGATVRVFAPGKWFHQQIRPNPEWNCRWEQLHISYGANIGVEEWWSHKNKCDMAAYYYTVELRTDEPPPDVKLVSELPAALAWNGKVWIDEHQDGTRSLFWRVKMLDEDIATGQRIEPPSPILFDISVTPHR